MPLSESNALSESNIHIIANARHDGGDRMSRRIRKMIFALSLLGDMPAVRSGENRVPPDDRAPADVAPSS